MASLLMNICSIVIFNAQVVKEKNFKGSFCVLRKDLKIIF